MSVSGFPILLTAIPLLFAALCPIWGMWKREACFPWSLAGVSATAIITWALVPKISATGAIGYEVGGWAPPWGIHIRIDFMGLLMAVIISSAGLLILFYSWRYIIHEIEETKIPYYYTLFLLLFAAMLGFSITGDLFNLFVFMEIFSITSYALVAISGERKALRAAFKYLLMGAVSSITVLFSIALLYSVIGSLNMLDISKRLGQTPYGVVVNTAFALFIGAFAVKAAVFPVHMWLPDAHSIAPSPISAILSALVIKMGVLGIFRVVFTIYGPAFSSNSILWKNLCGVLSWAAAFSVVIGSAMAIIQRELKVMIAYSSVAHVGYILLGICMLSPRAMTGGLFNIIAHAMGKACFFLVAGSLIYKHNMKRIRELRGIGRTMPVTAGAFAIASLSIVGLPPTAGFMAKWYLLWGCFQKGRYVFAAMVLIGSLLSAIYCFRVVYYMFFTGPRLRTQKIDEVPPTMYLPAALLSLGTLVLGIYSSLVISAITRFVGGLPVK